MLTLQELAKSWGLSSWQLMFIFILIIICTNYLCLVFVDRFYTPEPLKAPASIEGFVGESDKTEAAETKYEWLDNSKIYDKFYASVYDQLVQGSKRSQLEVQLLLAKWQLPKENLRILDIGSGTGVTAMAFAKEGVGHIVGLDKSPAMIEYASQTNLPKSILTDKQKAAIEFRHGDVIDPSICKPQEFDCACSLYFTPYYIPDMDGMFRNLALWIRPGGKLAIQVVNKYKFDPILDSASPFAFSMQKYTKERINKSKVVFDKFDYEAEFKLDGDSNHAEFRETFKFKDGSVRRQRHSFNMPEIKIIINKAKAAGWLYEGYIDGLAFGFEYAYMLLFHH